MPRAGRSYGINDKRGQYSYGEGGGKACDGIILYFPVPKKCFENLIFLMPSMCVGFFQIGIM